jgi:hypothetical protein
MKEFFSSVGGWPPTIVWIVGSLVLSWVVGMLTRNSGVLRFILVLVAGALLGGALYYWTGSFWWFAFSVGMMVVFPKAKG